MTDDVGLEALKLLKIKTVAELLDLSLTTVRRLIDAERRNPGTGLESVKVGTAVRVAPEAIVEYKKRLGVQAGAA